LKDGKVYAGAGYYLNELTVPVRALMKEGYEITFANPKGTHFAAWEQPELFTAELRASFKSLR
jgi:hypothetical protein